MAKTIEENEAKDRFIAFLRETRQEEWTVFDEDVVVDHSNGRNFDYLLQSGEKRMALEIFRLVESEAELAQQRRWSEVIDALRTELTTRGIKDLSIRTPHYFSVTRPKFDSAIREFADAIQASEVQTRDRQEFEAGGFTCTRFDGLGQVVFTAMWGGAIDPTGRAYVALAEKLPEKNAQLNISDAERLLLILNWTHFVGSDEFTEACSQTDFDSLPNIDRIYFEVASGKILHVFDRDLFASFRTLIEPPDYLETLFICWLEHRLTRGDRNSFNLVKALSAKRAGVQWMPANVRQQVVRLGEDLVKTGDWENAIWTIRAFKDDPSGGEDDVDAKKTDDYTVANSVRARMCWLMQKVVVANKTDVYPEIFQIVEAHAFGRNLSARYESTVPLIELARRRYARQTNGEAFMSRELSSAIKQLAFRMLRENAARPPILNRMAYVFSWVRDLSEEEAHEVLLALLGATEAHAQQSACEMMIYYALYRKLQFPELPPFDSNRSRRLLEEQIVRGTPLIRANTMWVIHKMLEDKPDEFPRLWSYAAVLPEGTFDSGAFFHLHRIAERFKSQRPDSKDPVLQKANQRAKEHRERNLL